MLLDTPDTGELHLQGLIDPRTRVAESQRFGFDAIHENDAHAREGVVVELRVRRLDQIAPGKTLLVERHASLAPDIETHCIRSSVRLCNLLRGIGISSDQAAL